MFQRFVCFKFKADTPLEAIEQHMAMFAALQDAIPQIVAYSGGRVVPADGKPREYDSAHYVTYHTQADIETYFEHDAHQAFIAANKAIWERVMVVDSEVSGS